MDTVSKGNAFEDKAYTVIEDLIKKNTFGFPNQVRLFKKKAYRSEERNDDIIFDMSIEVWHPNASNFSILYLFECKHYETSIPVDKMGYFIGNVKQVRANKGVFISTTGFQKGALELAKFNRIMLIRAESKKDYDIILHRKNIIGTTIPQIESTSEVAQNIQLKMLCEIIDNSILNAFRQIENSKPLLDDHNIRELTKKDIETTAHSILKLINPDVWNNASGISLATLERYVRDELKVKLEYVDNLSGIVGSCDVNNQLIYIQATLPPMRKMFVLAHEIGHYILHKDLAMDQELYDTFRDPELNIKTNKFLLGNPKNWIEWQANYFAVALLLPNFAVIARLNWYLQEHGLPKGMLYMDDQPNNMRAFAMIINKMSQNFNTTKTSVQYRLMELNKLKKGTRLKGIGQIISENKNDFFKGLKP